MNLFSKISQDIVAITTVLAKSNNWSFDNCDGISVETPKDPSHGDMATNAAMIIANKIKSNPRIVAEILIGEIKKHEYIAEAVIAGPGFINLTLKQGVWFEQLKNIIVLGDKYGDSNIGNSERINIEFVSTNPTGPMHVGHARGAVYGDALATLLIKCQFAVVKEFYVNDAGKQIDKLAESVYVRYQQLCGENVELPEHCYPGDYIITAAKILHKHHQRNLLGHTQEQWLPLVKKFAIEAMLVLIRDDLARLGVVHEVFFHESDLHSKNKIKQAVDLLEQKGLIYRGILEPPKGKIPEDWEPRKQLLFKSTQFGDDCDRPLQKSDGSWTYFAAEPAYLKDKIDRGFHELILILGADHGGYVKRTKSACMALSDNKVHIDIKLTQLVNFLKDGLPLKMSKRAGNFLAVEDVLELVGKDVLRFIMLTRKNDMVLDFDVDKVVEQSKDNPVFYVQYANARANSILRNAKLQMPDAIKLLDNINLLDLSGLSSAAEIDLIKLLSYWPRQVEIAATHREPHRIAFYVQQVAAQFHAFWNRGKEAHDLRFIIEDNQTLTAARLTLVMAVSKIITSALAIIGVKAIDEM